MKTIGDNIFKNGKFIKEYISREGTECFYCGIKSFNHLHKVGTTPKEFERGLDYYKEPTPLQKIKDNPKVVGNMRLDEWIKQLKKYVSEVDGLLLPVNTKEQKDKIQAFKNLIWWIGKLVNKE